MSQSPSQSVPEDWLRLNAICPYYTMFPLDFPMRHLAACSGVERVLDPFCGRGTTLYAARLSRVRCVGVDINPVAVAIAAAKLVTATPGGVRRLAERLILENTDVDVPSEEFWRWGFHPDTLRELVALRAGLLGIGDSPVAVMLRALMLGILHGPRNKTLPSYLSNQMPRTYASKPGYAVRYWRERDMSPVRVDTLDVIVRRAQRVLTNVVAPVSGRVILGDAASSVKMLRDRFDLIVTSPPYYGMRTYVADQWMRFWFLGGPAMPEYGSSGQLAHQPSQDAFVNALAEVWAATALRSRPGARLVIRFGALPSAKTDPEHLLLSSLRNAGSGWHIEHVHPVGVANRRSRQSEQFGRAGAAIGEIDVVARLLPTGH